MSGIDWLVVTAGAFGIAWVYWYFFFADRTGARPLDTAAGVQEAQVEINGGSSPSRRAIVEKHSEES